MSDDILYSEFWHKDIPREILANLNRRALQLLYITEEHKKLSECMTRLGFVPTAPREDLLRAVEDHIDCDEEALGKRGELVLRYFKIKEAAEKMCLWDSDRIRSYDLSDLANDLDALKAALGEEGVKP